MIKRGQCRHLSRRALLGGLGAAAMVPQRAMARPALNLGTFEITVLSDGHLTVPTRLLARNVTDAEIKSAIGVSNDTVEPPCNVTLVRTPSDTILIDVGAGPHFMPSVGNLVENMAAAGIDRRAISKVLFTHAHPDHLWGVLDDFDDTPMFPNAAYLISSAELNFWLAEDALVRLPESRRGFATGANRRLKRILERLESVEPGHDIVSGIRVLDTSGHTSGHVSFEISAGPDAVVVLGDALTHPTISFAHPNWMPAADHHDAQGAATMRRGLLDRLATDRQHVIGFHLPFPGIGRVERNGTAYRFVPEKPRPERY
jgi:glyoxylase-like metal-dependent hydrolase (beta-lactamase superfamily II)